MRNVRFRFVVLLSAFVWLALTGVAWAAPSWESIPLTPDGFSQSPQIDGTLVVYFGWDGNDWEIFLYDSVGSEPSTTTTTTVPSVTTTTTVPPTTTTTSATVPPTTTTMVPPPPHFVDVDASPYAEAIQAMQRAGVISGYQVGGNWEFRPTNRVWRAQFAKMIDGALGLPVDELMSSPFTDLGVDILMPGPGVDNLYPHEYVAAAYWRNITNGLTATTFGPYHDVTRAQVVTMIVRGTKSMRPGLLTEPSLGYLGVLGSFSPVHDPNMRTAEINGLLVGLVGFGPSWDPWLPATRGEVAQLLWNLSKLE